MVCWKEADMAMVLLCHGSAWLSDQDVPWKDRHKGIKPLSVFQLMIEMSSLLSLTVADIART